MISRSRGVSSDTAVLTRTFIADILASPFGDYRRIPYNVYSHVELRSR